MTLAAKSLKQAEERKQDYFVKLLVTKRSKLEVQRELFKKKVGTSDPKKI